jgi:cytosine/creatinine deaminase
MQGRVTLSHAFCLGATDEGLVDPLLEDLAASGVAVMTTGPAGWPAPSVARLANAVAQRNGFRRDEELALALDVCTRGGAAVMGLDGYGLEPGCVADFLLVDAETVAEAVARPPQRRRLVVKGGQVVARDGEALTSAP